MSPARQRDEMLGFVNYQLRLAYAPGIGALATKLANVTRLAPPTCPPKREARRWKLTSEGGR